MRKAELFGITIGERWGGAGLGDIEAAIVLEELARADVSSAILAQLIFNGPPRAIEHLGTDALKDRWLPIAATRRRPVLHRHQRDRSRAARSATCAPASRPTATASASTPTRTTSPAATRRCACLVWCRFPGSEGVEGHRRGRRRPRGAGRERRRHAREDGPARRRAKPSSRSTTCASSPTTCSLWGDPDEQRVVQDADRAHQPRAVRQRGDVRRRRAGRARVRGAVHERAQDRRHARSPTSRACSGRSPTWRRSSKARGCCCSARCTWPARTARRPALETAMAKTAANLAAKFVCDEAIQLLGGYGFSREYPVERVVPRHPRPVHRRGHGRDPAQLRRHAACCAARRRPATAGSAAAPDACSRRRSHPRRPSTARRAARGTARRSTRCSPTRPRRARSRGRGRRRRAARGRRRPGRRGRVAVAQPRRGRRSPTARAGARRGRGTGAPPGRARRSRTRCCAARRARRASSLDLDALPDAARRSPMLVRTASSSPAVLWTSGSSGAPKGVLHTQATLAYKAAHHGPGPRTRPGRLRADAGAVRAHLRAC